MAETDLMMIIRESIDEVTVGMLESESDGTAKVKVEDLIAESTEKDSRQGDCMKSQRGR